MLRSSYIKISKLLFITIIFISLCLISIACNNKVQPISVPDESLLLIVSSTSEINVCDLYIKELGKEEEKVASDVKEDSVISYNNGNVILYVDKTSNLFLKQKGMDKINISGDIYSKSYDYVNGKVYYRNNNSDLYSKEAQGEKNKIGSNVNRFQVLSNDNLIYLTSDKSLYLASPSDKEKVASDVLDYGASLDSSTIAYITQDKGLYIKEDAKQKEKIDANKASILTVAPSGKLIVFLDEYNDTKKMGELYIKCKGEQKLRIASDVKYYLLSPDEKLIIYLNQDGQLFTRNTRSENNQLIANDVSQFEIHDDIILYKDNENDMYLQKIGSKDKELIGNDLSPYYFTNDGSVVFRNEDGDLYMKNIGRDKTKIASDVINIGISNDVIAYYTKSNELYFGPLNDIQLTVDNVKKYSLIYLGNRNIYQRKVTYDDIIGIWKYVKQYEYEKEYCKFIEFTTDHKVIINTNKPEYANISLSNNNKTLNIKRNYGDTLQVTPYFNNEFIQLNIVEVGNWKFSRATSEERYKLITMDNDMKTAASYVGYNIKIPTARANIYDSASINADNLGYLVYGDIVRVNGYTYDNSAVWLQVTYLNKTDQRYYPAWINTKDLSTSQR